MARSVPAEIASKLPGAATVFAEHGFEGARIEDVARATGVPRATLYYYFSGKEDILAFLLGTLLEEVADNVARAANTAGTARERLRGVLRAQLEVLGAHPHTAQLLVANLGHAGRLGEIAAAVDTAFHEPVRGVLRQGAADGSLRSVDVERAASAVFGAVVLVGLHEILVHGELAPADVLPDVEAVVLTGLGTA